MKILETLFLVLCMFSCIGKEQKLDICNEYSHNIKNCPHVHVLWQSIINLVNEEDSIFCDSWFNQYMYIHNIFCWRNSAVPVLTCILDFCSSIKIFQHCINRYIIYTKYVYISACLNIKLSFFITFCKHWQFFWLCFS